MLNTEATSEIIEGVYYAARGPRLMEILDAVSAVYRIGKRDIMSQCRLAHIVVARDAFYYLAKKLTCRSLVDIGAFLNGRHHTTVLHGIQKVSAKFHSRKRKLVEVLKLLGIDPLRVS